MSSIWEMALPLISVVGDNSASVQSFLSNLRVSASTGNLRRNPLYLIAFLIFFIYAADKLADYVIGGDLNGLAYVALLVIVGASTVAMLNNWRSGLYLFLTWLLFEDLARKYLGNNMAIYFGKDFLVAIVYIAFFIAWRDKKVATFRFPFRIPLLLFLWFAIMQIFNPAATSIFYGLMGFKLYFYYVPLMFIGYALIDSEKDLRRLFSVSVGLAAVISALGIAQAILGHTFLNPAHPADDIKDLSQLYRVAPISGVIIYRPTSVFVSDGRFSAYLILAFILAVGFAGYLILRSRIGRIQAFVALVLVIGAIALAGSRGALIWTFLNATAILIAFFWGAPWRQGEAMRIVRTVQRVFLGTALAVVILLFTFPDALLSRYAFYNETLSLDSPSSELVHRARDYPMENFIAAFDSPRWPYGYGLGTASLGTQYVARIMHAAPMGVGVESGYGEIVLELGIVGLALWLIMSLSIVFSTWKVVKKMRGSPLFPLAFVIFWYTFMVLVPLTYNGLNTYQNFVMNAYLWLLIGVVFRLPSMKLAAESGREIAGTSVRQSRTGAH
jgi:hypothetical protein